MSEDEIIKEERILSVHEAIAYGLPNAGTNAVLGIVVSFNILYFVNIMGMPAILAGGSFSFALYLYAFLCPVWGAICDKFETRFGRKKTVMLITGPISTILFLLLYLNPRPTADMAYGTYFMPLILWYLIILIAFRITGSGFYSTYTSLLPEISTDEQNRIKVTTINMAVMIVGVAIGLLGPIFLLGETTKDLSRDNPELYYPFSSVGRSIADSVLIFAIVISIFYFITILIMLKIIKEPQAKSCEMSMKQVLTDLVEPFKDDNFKNFLISYFLLWVALVSLNYILMNLITFVLQLRGSEFIVFAIIAFSAAVGAFVFWNKMSSTIGLKNVTSLCLVMSIIAFLMMQIMILPLSHEIVFILGLFLVSFVLMGYVGSMIFPWAIVSDIVDTAEAKMGRALSGSYAGAFNLILSFAAATSMLMVSVLLELFGAESKIAYALVFLIGVFLLVPAVLLFQKVNITGTHRRKDKSE